MNKDCLQKPGYVVTVTIRRPPPPLDQGTVLGYPGCMVTPCNEEVDSSILSNGETVLVTPGHTGTLTIRKWVLLHWLGC